MVHFSEKPTMESLRPGTPIAFEFSNTLFLGLIGNCTALAHTDTLLTTVYYATDTQFTENLPTHLRIPEVSSRIPSSQLCFPNKHEYAQLFQAKRRIDHLNTCVVRIQPRVTADLLNSSTY